MTYLTALIRELAWHAHNARHLAHSWGENMRNATPDHAWTVLDGPPAPAATTTKHDLTTDQHRPRA